jgi:beta-lactamase superfamily II metal-dependent hydrolase
VRGVQLSYGPPNIFSEGIMKKETTTPSREESLQALINYLTDNGVTDFNANILIHTNMEAFGGHRNMLDEIRDENWDLVWNVAELYIQGDLW